MAQTQTDPRIALGIKMRWIQEKCKLSTNQTKVIASMLANNGTKPNLRAADRELQKESGVQFHVLHGCVSCHKHVFDTKDKSATCPKCGYCRYQNGSNTPHEAVCYFPLKSRLQALLQLPRFMKFLQVLAWILFWFDTNATCYLFAV